MPQPLNRVSASKPQTRPVKVLQFGEGNFLRAFADWMIDILNEKTDFNGAVQIIKNTSRGTGEGMNAQDGLYHVVLNGIQNGKGVREIRLITCVTGVLNPYENYQAYLKLGKNPDLKFIISNTTEAGIVFDAKDTDYNKLPSSFPGKITALLHHRFKTFEGAEDKAPVIIPTELIEKNGETLRSCILQYITLWKLENDFKAWIENDVVFCNTLVDRIVPGFPKDTM